ncbi:MAG: PhzF family phenazine biosynthesis protein [Clostridiales Family XIII bacterium]|jgi:PhzF family phenazine biosynthesis protein|nr:PhzF family phenazine biosynthesis protein [Clostridiales Family XIII bacterium]
MPTRIYIVSAFCKDGNGGNEAGVVLFEEGLDVGRKKAMARELGRSETVFVTRAERADFKLEYFTPTEEVPLCGHATIAAFALMRRLGILDESRPSFVTKAGALSIFFDGDTVFMEQVRPEYFETIKRPMLAKCFDAADISAKHPIQIVSTGLRDILLPIESAESLHAMTPRFDEIAELSRKYDAVGIHAFALRDERILCRNFAPNCGIPEEAATGTANCALAGYLRKHGIMKKNEYRMEQGYSLGSPSEITVRIEAECERISRVFAGGKGRLIGETLL